jgi:hypothetical protein
MERSGRWPDRSIILATRRLLVLTLHLDLLASGRRPWHWSGSSYTDGPSHITPFAHPNLEHFLLTDGETTLVAVRERARHAASPPTGHVPPMVFVDAREKARAWPLDFHLIELGAEAATIQAGSWGTAPLYLHSPGAGVLTGSWEYADIARRVPKPTISRLEIMRSLTWWHRYTRYTPIEEISMLTERATAHLALDGLTVSYPSPALHSSPRSLRKGANPIAAFDILLNNVVDQRWYDPSRSTVELSGGMDSATVGLTLGHRDPDVVGTCAILLPGKPGKQQAQRRREITQAAHLTGSDVTVHGVMFPPLHVKGPRTAGDAVLPTQEFYSEAFDVLFSRLREAGIDTAFTGVGGDELLALRPGERDRPLDWDRQHPTWLTKAGLELVEAGESALAPASIISEVTLMAFAAGAPLYLRHGIWPISPLAAPQMITFGEWLPVEWREKKTLLRRRLLERGLSTSVAHPALTENLAGVMNVGMTRWGLKHLENISADSRLAELGVIDPDALRAAVARVKDAGVKEDDHPLIAVILAEMFVESVTS